MPDESPLWYRRPLEDPVKEDRTGGEASASDATQLAVCPRCEVRLLIVGPPAGKGSSAMFSVACIKCRARVLLPIAFRRVTSVTLAPADED